MFINLKLTGKVLRTMVTPPSPLLSELSLDRLFHMFEGTSFEILLFFKGWFFLLFFFVCFFWFWVLFRFLFWGCCFFEGKYLRRLGTGTVRRQR